MGILCNLLFVFVQPTCFGYHKRNGRFGRNAVGVVWYIGLRMDNSLLDHLERPSFFWKGIYCISSIEYEFFQKSEFKDLKAKLLLILFFFLQIIWFTALFPYFVMSVLLVRSVTLPGASIGLWKVRNSILQLY